MYAPKNAAKEQPLAWGAVPESLKTQLGAWVEMLIEASSAEGEQRKACFLKFTDSFVETDVGPEDRAAFSDGLSGDPSWSGRLLGEIAQCAAGEDVDVKCQRKKKAKAGTKKRKGKKGGAGPIQKIILAFPPLSPAKALARYLQLAASSPPTATSSSSPTPTASAPSADEAKDSAPPEEAKVEDSNSSTEPPPQPPQAPAGKVGDTQKEKGKGGDGGAPRGSGVKSEGADEKRKKKIWREVAFTLDEKRQRWSAEG